MPALAQPLVGRDDLVLRRALIELIELEDVVPAGGRRSHRAIVTAETAVSDPGSTDDRAEPIA
jgi:hypothetical protein